MVYFGSPGVSRWHFLAHVIPVTTGRDATCSPLTFQRASRETRLSPMDSRSQLVALDSERSLACDSAATDAAFSGLVEAATVEFLSSLQLLAERARFLTGAAGVAIAIKDGGKFLYRASSGSSASTGTLADKRHAPVANCIATGKPSIVSAHTSRGQLAQAAVPVLRHHGVTGFFELSAVRASFSNEDVLAVSNLAEMLNTALDHMEAAESVHRRMLDSGQPSKAETATARIWHAAPEPETSAMPDSPPLPVIGPLNVHACQSCGFPVSDGRKLCVECEQNPGAANVHEPRLLAIETENEENWISAHGYTIASLFVTALVVAIIFWLR
jgi:hypothetical protein